MTDEPRSPMRAEPATAAPSPTASPTSDAPPRPSVPIPSRPPAGGSATPGADTPPEGRPPVDRGGQHVVLLSGLSGGGKTAAAKLFEDLAYTVVDNLPSELLPNLAELVLNDGKRFSRVAIVLDVRAGDAETAYRAMRGALEGRGIRPQVFFLEASDEALIRRFSETRHRHPLANGRSTQAAISLERRLLDPIRAEADVVVDTTDLPLRELRERLFARIADLQPDTMTIQLISFGFKFGIPLEADLVFDTRFIQNPYYVPELRDLSGLTDPVRTFVLEQPGASEYLDLID